MTDYEEPGRQRERPRRIRPRADDQPAVVQLARLLAKAAPLAAQVNSEEFSDGDRARLRELVGAYAYFYLTVDLNQMCSARARRSARARATGQRGTD